MTSQNDRVTPGLSVRQGYSTNPDAEAAVRELAGQIHQPQSSICLVFFSDEYDRQQLGRALQQQLPGPVVGCTTAGQLTAAGFQRGGISGITLASDQLLAVPYLISPLATLSEQVERIAAEIQGRLGALKHPRHHLQWVGRMTPDVEKGFDPAKLQAFGLLLVDGLSAQEELLTASLYRALGDVPIIGGSAGDMLKFQQTFIYHDGQLLSDAAIFTLFFTSLPFQVFKHQHFLPTANRLVITEAEPSRRLVREINGEPAVVAYARLIGMPVAQLNAAVFSRYPLMLRIRDDYYVRSIAGIEPDGGLRFYCAIDKGLVLTIGEGHSAGEALAQNLEQLRKGIGEPSVIIGCDCILRRLELEERGLDDRIGQLMGKNKVFGFSTYGEQFNSLHVNQTFTGVAIGGVRGRDGWTG